MIYCLQCPPIRIHCLGDEELQGCVLDNENMKNHYLIVGITIFVAVWTHNFEVASAITDPAIHSTAVVYVSSHGSMTVCIARWDIPGYNYLERRVFSRVRYALIQFEGNSICI